MAGWYDENDEDGTMGSYTANIDGRTYNSGTAKFIVGYEYGNPRNIGCEELYQKRTGEYFLVREVLVNEYNYGKVGIDIVPIADDEAEKWQINPYSLADKPGELANEM